MNLQQASYTFPADELLTPSLVIYPEIVRQNIHRTIELLGGDAGRWRPHLKTVKLAAMVEVLVQAGVKAAKCATTLELRVACESGMSDVLVAFAHSGANAARIVQIARRYPHVRVCSVVESEDQLGSWIGTPVGLFIDINPGMDRTGMDACQPQRIAALAGRIQSAGIEFRGLHFYDGQATEADLQERTRQAHRRYDQLLAIVAGIEGGGIRVNELITSGTPGFPCSLTYGGFRNAGFKHQVSPGTLVYNDATSILQVPEIPEYLPAVVVISRVISHPKAGVFTCDAGHKSVSVDCGVPNCVVLDHPGYRPQRPSEEHLPMEVPEGEPVPALGSILYLVPRHVCPTVNNFDFAALVEQGKLVAVAAVTARGHEGPLAAA